MFPSFKKMLHEAWGGSVKGVKAEIPLLGSKSDTINFHRVDQENRHVSDQIQFNNSIGNVLTIHVLPTKTSLLLRWENGILKIQPFGFLCHYQGPPYQQCLFC